MKKVMTALLLAALVTLTGCGTFGNGKLDNPLVATPYQAGRTFVFVDVVTSPVQPQEVQVVVNQVYAIAQNRYLDGSLTDDLIKAQIAQLYPDATPEFRQVMFNLYSALTARILNQAELNPDLPDIEVLSEFNRGIRDALELYKPEALSQ
jgi:hypothetical protein